MPTKKTPTETPKDSVRNEDPKLVTEFLESISERSDGTKDVYGRTLRQLAQWLSERPGGEAGFEPERLTRTAVSTYLEEMGKSGYSIAHRTRTRAVISRFSRWLIEEKGGLTKNPARDVAIPPQQQLAPRELSPDQRYVLQELVERDGTARSAAMFALGYWAGCRVSDVSHLLVDNCQIGPKIGLVKVGYKGGKMRELDLRNEVRKPLYEYLNGEERNIDSEFVFVSQRAGRLTEAGIHHWLRALKEKARKGEWDLIQTVTFHDLRHDFAHRARAAGWTLEEIAFYLGHVTNRGTPAIQTTVRYTQVSREQMKEKLKKL